MKEALAEKKITFIGAGSMAEAIIRGLTQKDMIPPGNLFACNRSNLEQLEQLQLRYGITGSTETGVKNDAIHTADIVVIAMKPKDVNLAFAEFSGFLRKEQLLVSVVAGLSLETMEALVPSGMPIVRTMPNTSSSIGMGATGICFSRSVSSEQQKLALEMFKSIGEVYVVPESLINMVNGISGSGPAYVYYFMEALIAAGIEGGLEPELARELTVQTVLGAAAMVRTTQEDPAVLRRKVTSPNGTTQAALEVFDRFDFTRAVAAAVDRCVERAAEIGEQISSESKRSIAP